MAFDPDLLELMHDTFTHGAATGHDGYGGPTSTTDGSGVCHVTYSTKLVRGNTEESSDSTAQIVTPPPGYVINGIPTPTINIDDTISVSGGDGRRVLTVEVQTDETGAWVQSAALT